MTVALVAALTAASTLGVTPAAAGPADSWTLAPGAYSAASDIVRVGDAIELGRAPAAALSGERTGIAEFAPRTLNVPARRITASGAQPGVEVDVRGRGQDGWTQWYPAPATLPQPSDTVQVRFVLGEDSRQNRPITLAASALASPQAADRPADASTYTVFATREGLVGGRTASGHVITQSDHFVALPSRRALSIDDDADYQVTVCAGDRCVTEPVLDVGPWNTHDDYWNTCRENFGDLPQGTPEAQAAYTDDYHAGTDSHGRRVRNPAGIDLADGTFADLGLSGNAWVSVRFDWTG